MNAFAATIDAWRGRVRATLDELPRRVALEAAARLVERSPVATGRFVANWQVRIDESPVAFDASLVDPDKAETERRLAAEIGAVPAAASIALVNAAPYAAALEYGSPTRPPVAMVRPTLQELPSFVAHIVAEGDR